MKNTLVLLGALLITICANAQEKIKEVVTEKYNRNSVSYVFVDRTQQHAADVNNFIANLEVDEKFDRNNIQTIKLNMPYDAGKPSKLEDVTSAVNSANLGKEIISFIYNRKPDGTFDDALILERGLYDAKDQDIKNAGVAKVEAMSFQWGEPLVNTSYIVVVDIYKTAIEHTKRGTIYSVNTNAHAYKLNAGREVLDDFYANAWADATTPEAEKAKAVAAYDEMVFELTHVATIEAAGTSSTTSYSQGSISQACQSAYENIVYKFEKEIPAWQVATSVISTRPIAAKIGKKEGVKNGSRFQAYSYKENKDGELVSVKRGKVRATVVSDNRTIATGDTQPSYFYQISGAANIKEGYTLKQKNDLKLGASLAIGMSPIGFRIGLDMDYICHIGKKGCITYAMANFGANIGGDTPYDTMLGAGYGIPLSRFFEITPYVMGGSYFDTEFNPEAYFAEPGVRLAVTLQPVSIYVAAGYQVGAEDLAFLGIPISAKFGIKLTF